MPQPVPELSIVTTLYKSASYIREFYDRISAQAEIITHHYEIIFVDDGSPDDSLPRVLAIHRDDPRVKVIELSRNFGHHKAVMTGLAHARGKYVFLIDSDLEEPPEMLTQFYEILSQTDADVVFGVQKKRKGTLFEQVSGTLFYKVFNVLSPSKIPENVITARLMRRPYVEALVSHKEREVCLAGLFSITGFKQVPVMVEKLDKGESIYTLQRRIDLAVRAITSFSDKPLVLIFYLGSLILLLSGTYLTYLVFRKLFFGIPLAGYTSLIVSIWFLGGLTIFAIGIIGVYLARIYVEAKQRPYSVIRSIYSHDMDVQKGKANPRNRRCESLNDDE
ncbi:MAG: glycosyltransferase family 2 protein [Deltaproteobacteria bacterium]|nr:glycosyltransferase family 2 protein [Deltaproteobacteria bacterium]